MTDYVQFGTTTGFTIPALPGAGGDQGVLRFNALAAGETVLVTPGLGLAGTIGSWTLGYDLLVPAGQGSWTSFLQTTLANGNDGELFLRAGAGGVGGIGISGVYEGSFQYGAWQRVVFTAEQAGSGTTLRKYIDGALVGTQALTGTRWQLDADDGFLILSDNDGDVSQGFLSSFLFAPSALTGAGVAALGGADADGFFAAAPVPGASQFDFAAGTYAATYGPATLAAPGDEDAPPPAPLARVNPIADVMRTPGSTVVIDLAAVFSEDGLTYTVENDDAAVVTAAVIDGETLTLTLGALGHADLRIVATDADGNSAADAFRVRSAGPNAYTIAVLPDTQDYTDASLANGRPETFHAMTEWLVANQDGKNIVFAIHVGDVTQDNLASHWEVANRALTTLDGKVAYSLLPGNHDQALGGTAADHSSAFLDALFSPARQAASNPGTFGGTYDQEPERGANSFHTFEAPDGTDWLVVSLEFGPRDDVLRWAADVIGAHLDHQVIIASHSLTNWPVRHDPAGLPLYDEGAGADYGMGRDPEGANDGETVYRELLARFPNIAMTFSGHIFGDGAEVNESYSQHGNRIVESLVNYQNGVAREITGNGDPALGGQGGNGAMRLVTIDPDNDRVTTEAYFTVFDDYLDGFRVSPELDRDGLTGRYRGHEEVFEDWDLSAPPARAVADAGDDVFVAAGPGEVALVTLDGSRTLDPGGVAQAHVWTDEDGDPVALGETQVVPLPVGRHALTLAVTDAAGNTTTDTLLVVVTGARTLLLDTFNDGDIDGWALPGEDDTLVVGSPESFGLPAIPGDAESVLALPALPPTQALTLSPNLGAPEGTLVGDYSLVMDILVPDGQGTWTALWQTDVANASDGELFIRSRGDGTGGIGISGVYDGSFAYGAWQRVGFVFDDLGNGTTTLAKYIGGALVGTQTLSGDRWKLDVGKGALLFSDEDGETSDLFVSSVLVTDRVFTAAEMAALGGVDAGGVLDAPPSPVSVQFDFGDTTLAATWGVPSLGFGAIGTGSGSFLVKGTVFSRPVAEAGLPAPEGRVFDQSDAEDNVLLWADEAALAWADYVLTLTLRSTDNDGIGAAFNWQDEANHHRVVLDGEANTLSLIRVKDGVETVLAEEAGSTRFNTDQTLKVVTLEGGITAFLDGRLLFGGTVTDTEGAASGTVGLWSDTQRSSQFDTVLVEAAALDAHAGRDQALLDRDGDGAERVSLSAAGTTGPDPVVAWAWRDAEGNLRGTGAETAFDLPVGRHALTLTVTDATGATATDRVDVEVVGRSRILLDEDFDRPTIPGGWRIVDQGEFGGLGPDGTRSDWRIASGALTQFSDLASRQLTWNGASNADVWKRGWSPHGDGVSVLRQGTTALHEGPGASAWQDIALEARITTPDDDGLGFLFRHVDADNHYKLEIDAEGVYDRSPGNGAGPLITLTRKQDGIEDILAQVPRRYTPGEAFDLRVELREGRIEAFLDGWEVFAYAIEDRAHAAGTIGLYSWGSAGVAFDDVTVVSLEDIAEPVLLPALTFLQGAGGTPKGAIPAAPVAPAAQVARRVTVEAEGGTTTVENVFAWNEMKVVVFEDEYYVPAMGTSFTFANFVDVRVDLGAAIAGLDLDVIGAKRGSVVGSALGDRIDWIAHSNERTFSNSVVIDAGGGDDVITLGAVGGSDRDEAFLADNARPDNGPLWNARYDGRWTVVTVDGGAGDDAITAADRVVLDARGGAGNDVITGGDGQDSVTIGRTLAETGIEAITDSEGTLIGAVLTTVGDDGSVETDRVSFVERFVFSDGARSLDELFAAPWSFVLLPDTQFYSVSDAAMAGFTAQAAWIEANREAENIRFVSHLGDVTQNATPAEFARTLPAMERIAATGLPHAVLPGNHDFPRQQVQLGGLDYLAAYGPSSFLEDGTAWFGGASPNGYGTWQVFETGWPDVLHIALEWGHLNGSLNWVEGVLDRFSGMPTMISVHAAIAGDLSQRQPGVQRGLSDQGSALFEQVVRANDQVFAVFNGHYFEAVEAGNDGHEPGEYYDILANDAGSDVLFALSNYQGLPGGGQGYFRLITYDDIADRFSVRTISAVDGVPEQTDPFSRFDFAVDLADRDRFPLQARPEVEAFTRDAEASVTLSSAAPWLAGDGVAISVGKGAAGELQGLLKVDLDALALPEAAALERAILKLHVLDGGPGAQLFRMTQAWDADARWDTFGADGVTPSLTRDEAVAVDNNTVFTTPPVWVNTPPLGSLVPVRYVPGGTVNWDAQADPSVTGGSTYVDVTESVMAWLSGEANEGWLLRNPNSVTDTGLYAVFSAVLGGGDVTTYAGADHPDAALRPELSLWFFA